MPEGYLHLTCEQRCQIYPLLQSGHSQAHIARQIGVDPSTISRELVRNMAIVRKSLKEILASPPESDDVDWAKLRATTDEDISAHF